MQRAEFFRLNAAYCLKKSQEATTPETRADWLRMSEFWHRLAQHAETQPADPLYDEMAARLEETRKKDPTDPSASQE